MSLENITYRLTHWETWDWRIKYIPLVPLWVWHCIRSGSFWFFTPSNPTLLFGGFEGETKRSIYKHLPPESYPKSIYISPKQSFSDIEQLITTKFNYPFAVKPDVGRMGFMFRIIKTSADLKLYHEKMPVDYIVQELITYPLEVSVFYYRFPDNEKGTITGFIRKEFLEVTGDGKSTLLLLMKNYPRIRFRLDEMKSKHRDHLDLIIPKGDKFCLSYALNLSRGGKLVSLEHEKDERLLKIFDDLSHYSGKLYFGRYDIKCTSIDDLKEGKNFSILEFNGSGAEPHHVYGNGFTLLKACRILAYHWKILYKISKLNHKRGVAYWDFKRGLKLMLKCRRYFSLLKKIDTEFPAS
ncbi:hypothetical protein WG906_16375 [Pedobacter sp. P351]|uniref:hypothetical protein n=1 Tax=Pedobacter superstes TaxID=3133441 RepID=UPI003098C17C